MTGLITSDLHLNEHQRDQHRWDFTCQILPRLLSKHKVDWLAILGDLTDEKDNHSAVLTNKIVSLLTLLAKQCRVYILRGNHDCIDPDTPFFKFVGKLKNIYWINKPTVIELEEFVHVLWLPHSRDPKLDWSNLDSENINMIFAHQTFSGAVSESGAALDGVKIADVLPDGIPIVSGDVHVPQDIGCVTYVGSPYRTTFTANDYSPRVLIYNNNNIRSIWMSGPQKQLIIAESISTTAKKLIDAKGDIVKLRVNLTPEEAINWQGIKQTIEQEARQAGVVLHSIEAILDVPTKNKKYKLANKAQSDEEILRTYIKQQGIEEAYIKAGTSIVQKGNK